MVSCLLCTNAKPLYVVEKDQFKDSGYVICSHKHKLFRKMVVRSIQPSCKNFSFLLDGLAD
jgi:hypothetical protein